MKEDNEAVGTGVAGSSITSKLRAIKGLDVDSALGRVSERQDVYERVVGMAVRLFPERIAHLDEYLSAGNLKKFAFLIHGLNGVLKNIGASALGDKAARIERAAKAGEAERCAEEYLLFKALLTDFTSQLNSAVAPADAPPKEKAGRGVYADALSKARLAAQSFDAVSALEIIRPLTGFSYDDFVDDLLKKAVFALEEFNCEGALTNILKMEEILNESR